MLSWRLERKNVACHCDEMQEGTVEAPPLEALEVVAVLKQRSSPWIQKTVKHDKLTERRRLRKSEKKLLGEPCKRNRPRRERQLLEKRRPKRSKRHERFKRSGELARISGAARMHLEKHVKLSMAD